MKTKSVLLFFLFAISCLSAQIKTQNIVNAQEATVFILPQNVIPNGKIISHGPPNPKKKGKSYLIHFRNETVYIVKTEMVMDRNAKGHQVVKAYKIVDGASAEVAQELSFSTTSTADGIKGVNITGTINGTEEWDISFEGHAKHDLKSSYFLDFAEEKGFEVVLNMQQK